jgi:histidine kinase
MLRQLRWKLFISHVLILLIGVGIFLPTAYFLTSNPITRTPDEVLVPVSVQVAASVDENEASNSQPTAPSPNAQAQIRGIIDNALLISSFGALAGAIVVSLFVSRRVVEPLQELTQVSGRLARGYFRERTSIRSEDELAVLSQSINQLAETLEQTEQRRLGLITDVAHELRTPLATIEGYMEGLMDEVVKPEPKLFALIHHEATRLKWMIEEMALLSRAEAGQLRVQPRPIDLPPLLQQVAEQFQPQVAAQNVALEVSAAPNLPRVNADPDRVEQILINLIANAVQYTPAGGRIVVFAYADELVMHIGVRDTGVGIAAEHLPHIFERFYRIDKSRARQSGGAGIGLTIARHLVYAHGGEIWAESDGAGKGTTVKFTLPVIDTVPIIH